jgi:hypothetical protein
MKECTPSDNLVNLFKHAKKLSQCILLPTRPKSDANRACQGPDIASHVPVGIVVSQNNH